MTVHSDFSLVSIKSPGKTNDLKAYHMSVLSELIEKLPEGYFCGKNKTLLQH